MAVSNVEFGESLVISAAALYDNPSYFLELHS